MVFPGINLGKDIKRQRTETPFAETPHLNVHEHKNKIMILEFIGLVLYDFYIAIKRSRPYGWN